jgi:hypothetical protein
MAVVHDLKAGGDYYVPRLGFAWCIWAIEVIEAIEAIAGYLIFCMFDKV